jgi:dolichol-phosphate mannosyltransferase
VAVESDIGHPREGGHNAANIARKRTFSSTAMTTRSSTLVTLATYNEIENLPALVDAIFEVAPDVDILVIDDNSPDGTGRWCDERAAGEPRLRCLHRSGKLGLGTATIEGMKYAVEKGYDYLLNMDADFSHDPRYIAALRAGMDKADVMIGSRYVQGGAIEGWPFKRHAMSRAVNVLARTALRLHARDCSGAFRCYRVGLLAQVDFDKVRSRGYSFQEEILWHLAQLGARIAETPITFADRRRGVSKIDSGEAFGALRIILGLGARTWLGGKAKGKRQKAKGREQLV